MEDGEADMEEVTGKGAKASATSTIQVGVPSHARLVLAVTPLLTPPPPPCPDPRGLRHRQGATDHPGGQAARDAVPHTVARPERARCH